MERNNITNIEKSFREKLIHEYQVYVESLKSNAIIAKPKFLNLSYDSDFDKPNFCNDLIWCYRDLIFFPDDEILRKLQEIGFKPVRWFVGLKEIEAEFIKLEAEGFFISRHTVLLYIQSYFLFKIFNEVLIKMKYYGNHDGRIWNSFVKEVYETFRRTQYAWNLDKHPNALNTIMMLSIIKKIGDEFEEKPNRKVYTNLFRGKNESLFLPLIIENIKLVEPYHLNRVLSASYGLFRLILQDYDLDPDDELYNSKKASKLKRIIYKK